MNRNQWIEVEDEYLTNQPRIWQSAGRGRKGEFIPDPNEPPTEAYLFCHECRRRPRSIKRKRFLKTIKGQGEDEIINGIIDFIGKDDVVLLNPKIKDGELDKSLGWQQRWHGFKDELEATGERQGG